MVTKTAAFLFFFFLESTFALEGSGKCLMCFVVRRDFYKVFFYFLRMHLIKQIDLTFYLRSKYDTRTHIVILQFLKKFFKIEFNALSCKLSCKYGL